MHGLCAYWEGGNRVSVKCYSDCFVHSVHVFKYISAVHGFWADWGERALQMRILWGVDRVSVTARHTCVISECTDSAHTGADRVSVGFRTFENAYINAHGRLVGVGGPR